MQGKVEVSEIIELAGAEEKDLRLPGLGVEDYVSVRVLGPDGKVVSSARVAASWWDGEPGPRSATHVVRRIHRPDGAVWLLRGWYAKQARPKGSVTINAGRLGRREEAFVFGETRDVEVKFAEPADLRVEVEGYRGSRVEGLLKTLAIRLGPGKDGKPARQASFKPRGQMSGDGVQEIEAGEPGEYLLGLFIESDLCPHTIALIPVTLQSGLNTVTAAIPALHSARIRVDVSESSRSRLEIQKKEGEGFATWFVKRIESPGEVVFDLLPAGAYDLTLHVDGIPTRARIEVPGKGGFELKPKPHPALLVRIDSETSTLAESGLQDGDLILGLGGVEFDGPERIEELLRDASGKAVEAAVVREKEGGYLIDVDFRSFMDRGTARVRPEAGGDLLRVTR
jgi:hypothetical protein